MRFFNQYFFSEVDQRRARRVRPHITNIDDAVASIYACLLESVAKASATPPSPRIGLLLSGGVDSSLLLALLNQNLPQTRTVCLTASVDAHDTDVMPSKEVAHHFGNRLLQCKINKQYAKEHLPEAMVLPHSGLYVAAANLALIRCLDECKRQKLSELWIGSGLDMMFGGGVNPKTMAHNQHNFHHFHTDFWKHSMP